MTDLNTRGVHDGCRCGATNSQSPPSLLPRIGTARIPASGVSSCCSPYWPPRRAKGCWQNKCVTSEGWAYGTNAPLPHQPVAAMHGDRLAGQSGGMASGGGATATLMDVRRGLAPRRPASTPYPRQAPCQSAQQIVGEPNIGNRGQSGTDGCGGEPRDQRESGTQR